MSSELPNYCGPHNERFALVCPECDREWFMALSREEKALVNYVSDPGVPRSGCKRYIEYFRKMEAHSP